jgi:hypothetical protein
MFINPSLVASAPAVKAKETGTIEQFLMPPAQVLEPRSAELLNNEPRAPSIVTSCRPANHKRKQYWSKLHSCRPIRNILEGQSNRRTER